MGKNYNQFTVIRNYISNNELETIKKYQIDRGIGYIIWCRNFT